MLFIVSLQFQYINKLYLQSTHHAARVHSRRHVHRVTPDVVLRLLGANHAGNDRAMVETHSQTESLETLAIDLVQHRHQRDGELDHNGDVMLLRASFVLVQLYVFFKDIYNPQLTPSYDTYFIFKVRLKGQ